MAGLYFHIPFCKQACHYCNFHFSTNREIQSTLVEALGKELALQKDYLQGQAIETIYFGGGTPSLLTEAELNFILHQAHALFPVTPDAEVTLEANPDDLTVSKLQHFKAAGINRLSLGIQTFQDSLLQFLNRAHDSRCALQAYDYARSCGFTNITIDLIYGIPGLDQEAWAVEVNKAIALQPEHISAYALTVEEKTAFGHWVRNGKLQPADEEVVASQLEHLMSQLTGAGYEHYEVSNFCKPGFYARHNSSYWKQVHYVGIGPGAHSYNGTSRQFNVRNNHLYVKAIEMNRIPAEVEVLTRENLINEYLLTTLRTSWGTDLQLLKNQYHYDLAKLKAGYLAELYNRQLISWQESKLLLTPKGKLLADRIAADLFV
jgi:oxygen-independent coproporphyrinogen-3 oxidase